MYQLNLNILTFLIIFYIYCFLGWSFESCYVSLKEKKWVNRGFMKGPFLPIYGSGAVIILFSTIPFMYSPILVYIVSVVSATLLELVTGFVMEKHFKVKYWDYSNNFLNYKGYICFKSSVAWGFMGMLVTYVINEPIAMFIESINVWIEILLVVIVSVIFITDFVKSYKSAYSLRELILSNERLIKELNEIKMQIAESIEEKRTALSEEIEERKVAFNEKRVEMANEIKEKIETALSYTEIDDIIIEKIEELKNLDMEEYINKWKEKAAIVKDRIEKIEPKRIEILRRNPSARFNFRFWKNDKK